MEKDTKGGFDMRINNKKVCSTDCEDFLNTLKGYCWCNKLNIDVIPWRECKGLEGSR